MKKRRICVTVICLCIALLFTACDKRTDVEEGDSFIYCLNEDRTGLVKVRYDITQEAVSYTHLDVYKRQGID